MIDNIGSDFLQKLKGFYFVAKSGSFSLAAAEIGKKQATVSRYVKALEQKFRCCGACPRYRRFRC